MVGREIVESETVSSVSFPLYFDFWRYKNLFDDPAITELRPYNSNDDCKLVYRRDYPVDYLIKF